MVIIAGPAAVKSCVAVWKAPKTNIIRGFALPKYKENKRENGPKYICKEYFSILGFSVVFNNFSIFTLRVVCATPKILTADTKSLFHHPTNLDGI